MAISADRFGQGAHFLQKVEGQVTFSI
jgi:hypothetical protein